MRRITCMSLVIALCATGALAQVRVPPIRTQSTLGACTNAQPKIVGITDGASATDLTTGGGAFDVIGFCLDGTWSANLPGAVALQGTTPGSAQTGNLNVTGTAVVGTQVTTPIMAAPVGSTFAASATAPAATTGASQAGKSVSLAASNAVASTDTAGAAAGGAVTITGGNAARLTSGDANGGDINLTPGTGIGTGTAGKTVIASGTRVSVPAAVAATPTFTLSNKFGGSEFGFYLTSGEDFAIGRWGSMLFRVSADPRLILSSTGRIGFASGAASGADDVSWQRDAAGIMDLRGDAGGYKLRVAGAYTNTTNFEGVGVQCDGAGACTIATETAGTGTDDMTLHLSGSGVAPVEIAGCKHWGLLATPPVTCAAGYECAEYADTSHAKCYCDGTTWNVLTGSGAGACS